MTGFYEGTEGQQIPVDHDLDQHTDVVIDTPTVGQTIVYDDVDGQFKNAKADLSINTLSDVGDVNDLLSPATNDVLSWSGTQWSNGTVVPGPIALNGVTDVVVPAPSEGDVLYFDGSNWVNRPLFNNNLIVGDGTVPASLTLSYGATTGLIEFNRDGINDWFISNSAGAPEALQIGNNQADLVIGDSNMTWNRDFVVTGNGNSIESSQGEVKGVTMYAVESLRFDGAGAGRGVYWGDPQGSNIPRLTIESGNMVLTSNTEIKLSAQTTVTSDHYIDLQTGNNIVLRRPSGTLTEGYNEIRIEDDDAYFTGGIFTGPDRNIQIEEGGVGRMISWNGAVNREHVPNWGQVLDYVDFVLGGG